jgi:hypothetical protein
VDDRRRCRRTQEVTKRESVYRSRRGRQDAKSARQRHERGIARPAGAAHLAYAITFTLVMHRTDLPWEEPRTAFLLVVVRGRRALAAQRERCGGETRHLASEPAADNPSEVASNERHRLRSA